MITLAFLGAAKTVTGSKFLVMEGENKILIDCGLFQGMKDLRLKNWDDFIVKPSEISHILLTHAHIDHSGYIPRLVQQGFKGKILTTQITKELCDIMLIDSGYLQEEEARYANKTGYSKHKPAQPLYTAKDAEKSLQYFHAVERNTFINITPNIKFRFRNAGHILGSSFIEMWIQNGMDRVKLVFSGDLGRTRTPILEDPDYTREVDYLILESTYGDRLHPATDPAQELKFIIKDIYKNKGCLLIPAFAVERTQEILYILKLLNEDREIPRIPIYIDSPMAIRVTHLFDRHIEIYDNEAKKVLEETGSLFRAPHVHFTTTQEESKYVNQLRGPMIILSASGMCTGGRILHHLKERLPDARNHILLAGYQAAGTRGRSLLEGVRSLRIHGIDVPVNSKVSYISSFSAHADYLEILKWLRGIKKAKPKTVFLVHGENNSLTSLKEKIETEYRWNVYIPNYLEAVKLGFQEAPPPIQKPFIF